MSISLIPLLLIVALAVVLPTFIVLTLAFAAIKRKNWGGLAVLGVIMFALPAAWLLAGVSTYQQDVKAKAEMKAADLREFAIQSAIQSAQSTKFDPTTSTASSAPPSSAFVELIKQHYGPSSDSTSAAVEAEVASDEELAQIASAPPKIELDSEIVIGDKAADSKGDRPDWIDGKIASNQTVIITGPHIDEESCRSQSRAMVHEWLDKHFAERWPNIAGFDSPSLYLLGARVDLSDVIVEEYAETRETTFGDMHLLYTLAEIRPEIEAELGKLFAAEAIRCQKIAGTRALSFAGAGVLSLVALTHVVLKSGGRKAKNGAS